MNVIIEQLVVEIHGTGRIPCLLTKPESGTEIIITSHKLEYQTCQSGVGNLSPGRRPPVSAAS